MTPIISPHSNELVTNGSVLCRWLKSFLMSSMNADRILRYDHKKYVTIVYASGEALNCGYNIFVVASKLGYISSVKSFAGFPVVYKMTFDGYLIAEKLWDLHAAK